MSRADDLETYGRHMLEGLTRLRTRTSAYGDNETRFQGEAMLCQNCVKLAQEKEVLIATGKLLKEMLETTQAMLGEWIKMHPAHGREEHKEANR